MLSNAQIKLIKSLHSKKYRDETGLFIAEGKKVTLELEDSFIDVVKVYYVNSYFGKFPNSRITAEEMKKISALTTPQDILALCKIPPGTDVLPDFNNELVIALDNIRNPGNLGTIIRIADWFGINQIFCSYQCADSYNPKVVQASMGSIGRVKIDYKNLPGALETCKKDKIPVFGAVLEGSNLYNEKLSASGMIIIGNESQGISAEIVSYVTKPIYIPHFDRKEKRNRVQSLNAAMAAAIICAEFRRVNTSGS